MGLNHQKTKQALTLLQKKIKQCRLCQEAFGYEPHPIIQGNFNAKIMQISQAPSRTVHETGRPFHDASGRRLRGEWYRICDDDFYNPDYFYIVSMAHCYPGKSPNGGDRRSPPICSKQWLQREVQLVQNEIYIIIGGIAASHFFPNEKITSLAFENKTLNGKPCFVLPHPSPLNMKWFRDYPEFTQKRIFEIQDEVHRVLGIDSIGASETNKKGGI